MEQGSQLESMSDRELLEFLARAFVNSQEQFEARFVGIDERMAHFEHNQDEFKSELRALAKAFDKDAVTSIDHEKRITRIERHLYV